MTALMTVLVTASMTSAHDKCQGASSVSGVMTKNKIKLSTHRWSEAHAPRAAVQDHVIVVMQWRW